MNVQELHVFGVIGFDGVARNGLRLHPDGEHLIYPMGSKIVVKHTKTGEQFFLTGHQNVVSALCVSPCGAFVASGQVNHHGFKAMVIVWDYEKRKVKSSYEMHKVRVEDVCFTKSGRYLISLGGKDDGRLIVWDVENGSPLCGGIAGNEASGNVATIARANLHEDSFLTAGDRTLKLWRIDSKDRKLRGTDVKVGKIKRAIDCLAVDENDENIYCGTTSGDIMKARLNIGDSESASKYPVLIGCFCKLVKMTKHTKSPSPGQVYAGGVKSLLLLEKGKLIVGTGDGTVESIEIARGCLSPGAATATASATASASAITTATRSNNLPIVPAIVAHRATNVCATVTSIVRYKADVILVGTAVCEIHEIQLSSFRTRLIVACHTSSVYGLAFPRNCSEIFATSGKNDIRVWKLIGQKELLRITVPNFTCSDLCFACNGASIISAWNDGAIRGFALNGGKLLFEISRAHVKSVTTIALTNDDGKLISGGCDGQVRVWDATSEMRHLLQVLKEHRGPITSLNVSPDDKYLLSSSTDGTCIMWDSRNFTRKFMLRGNTMYMDACFVPSGVQILTCGTDRKVAYWETLDGSLVRLVEGSISGTLNTISVSQDGERFVTGSDDSIVKLWQYRSGAPICLGLAHAAPVTASAFAPDGRVIVTASADGAIVLWKYPAALETSSPIANDSNLPIPSITRLSSPPT